MTDIVTFTAGVYAELENTPTGDKEYRFLTEAGDTVTVRYSEPLPYLKIVLLYRNIRQGKI